MQQANNSRNDDRRRYRTVSQAKREERPLPALDPVEFDFDPETQFDLAGLNIRNFDDGPIDTVFRRGHRHGY